MVVCLDEKAFSHLPCMLIRQNFELHNDSYRRPWYLIHDNTMNYNELIEELEKLNEESGNAKFKKSIRQMISLLEEVDKNMTKEEKLKIQLSIGPHLVNIQTHKDLKLGLRKLRKSLIGDFRFVPSNYYFTLGIGVGLAFGTALGISFGVPFDNGIVFGPMIGSGIGLIGGLIVGLFLDKKKESENRILKNL